MTMTPTEEANFLPIRAALDEWEVEQHVVNEVNYEFRETEFGGWNFDEPSTIKLRLDWEMDAPQHRASTTEQIFSLMSLVVAQDLTDLATNGDRTGWLNAVNYALSHPEEEAPPLDPLLYLMDGTVVHGKTLASITIHETFTYSEFKPGKDTFEYTVFMAVTFNWLP